MPVTEWRQQSIQPIWRRNGIVIQIGHDVGSAFGETAISSATEASQWLNYIPSAEVLGSFACVFVSPGIVDDQDLVGRAVQLRYGSQALPEECRSVTGTDDHCDSNLYHRIPCCQALGRGLQR